MSHNLTKQPAEKKVYEFPPFDLTAGSNIASVQSITITARGLVAAVAALTYENEAYNNNILQLTLLGGTDGEEYLITAIVVDSMGMVGEDDVELRVADFGWSVPDGAGHIYLTPAEYITRFGYEETLLLTDTNDVGRIDKDRLGARLLEATAFVDGYVAKRYLTPLSPVPEVIKGIIADLTRHALHGVSVSDVVADRARQARASLKDISGGNMVLVTTEAATTTTSGTPDFISPARVFNRGTLEGF
ncbi:MAG: DUF1320 domain-containing protein [Emcibacter sp.]|nr:DUF1320 domain-containing protein [Emcibacter sp.]